MLAFEFFTWWYGAGWLNTVKRVQLKIRGVSQVFSVGTLLRTLFAPWRRVMSPPGASFQDHLNAFRDNLIGRFVGFTVRVTVLFAAAIVTAFVAVGGAVLCVIWPLMPLLVPASLLWGVIK